MIRLFRWAAFSVCLSAAGQTARLDVTTFSGANAGLKIASAIASLANGGIVDATGLSGSQTISKSIAVGSAGKPITLVLGNATYLASVEVPFIIGSGSKILAQGSPAIMQTAGANLIALIQGTNVVNCEIAGITFDGNKANNTIGGSAISFTNSSKCSIHGNTIQNTVGGKSGYSTPNGGYAAINFSGPLNGDNQIRDNLITSVGVPATSYGDGLYISGPRNKIVHNTITFVSDTGVVCEACSSSIISQNTFVGNSAAIGVGSGVPDLTAFGNVIAENTIEGGAATTQGVLNIYRTTGGAQGTTIVSANIIRDVPLGHGIYVEAAVNVMLSNNIVSNVGSADNPYSFGICILNSKRIALSNNQITDSGSFGVGVSGTVDISILNNRIVNAARFVPGAPGIGFDVLGRHSSLINISGNIIYDDAADPGQKQMGYCIDFQQGGSVTFVHLGDNQFSDGVNVLGCVGDVRL